MKTKVFLLSIFLLVSVSSFSQRFYLGEELKPTPAEYKLLGISSATNVWTYQYIGMLTEKYFLGRKIGEVIVGIKNDIIVTTVFNLIPEKEDVGVPKSILDLVQSSLPYPMACVDGVWGVNIDENSISLSRSNNSITFNKDRIMFFSSVRSSLLRE